MDKDFICRVDLSGMAISLNSICPMSLYISSSDPMKHTEAYCYDCRNYYYLNVMGLFLASVNSDSTLSQRNNFYMNKLESFMVEDFVITRFLFGSWLLDDHMAEYPGLPIGIIIVKDDFYRSHMYFEDDMLIIKTTDLRRMVREEDQLLFKHDLVVQSSGDVTYILRDFGVISVDDAKMTHIYPGLLSRLHKRYYLFKFMKMRMIRELMKITPNHFALTIKY